jgi:serine/threonine-protein kinase
MSYRSPSGVGPRPRVVKSQRVSISGGVELTTKAAPPSPASVADRFAMQELLGEGGMGAVYVAQDKGLGRVVAIKQLRHEFEGNRGALRRFVLEAQIGAQLEHPNIVPLYSLERTNDGSPAIAMQLLEGRNMAQYIDDASVAKASEREANGAFALKERLGTLLGVCDAIQFAHDRGVVHRDLKPDNVMLGEHHEVYVMDWGLARVMGSADDTRAQTTKPVTLPAPEMGAPAFDVGATIGLPGGEAGTPGRDDALATRHGQVLGTPQYMAPEQGQGRVEDVGPAADQYALGVILLELTMLKSARSVIDRGKAMQQAGDGELELSDDVDGRPLPPALLAIIERATRVDANERYPSVTALADDIRRFIRDEPVSVYPEGPAKRLVRLAAKWPALATALVAGVLLLAAAGVVVSLAKSAEEAQRRAYDMEGSRTVLLAVGGRAHEIDVRLSDLAATVEAMGAAALQGLALDRSARAPSTAPLQLTPSLAYGGAPVSVEQPVADWPGKSAGAAPPPGVGPLWRIESWLRRTVESGLPASDRSGDHAARGAALLQGHGVLLRAFVGLEDGSFVQFPALDIPAGHEARQRPWYRESQRDPSLHWTLPVVDVAGATVRLEAVVALKDESGRFLGVAGTDLRVTVLAKELRLDLPGFRRAYLTTRDGRITVSETLRDQVLSQKVALDESPTLPKVDDRELTARLALGDQGGYVETADGKLLVFAKMISPPWTYVAELDAAPYLKR